MIHGTRWLVPLLCVLALAGCARSQPERPEWIIRSRLVFMTDDLGSERAPLAPERFRLLFSYIAGDLYGPPTTGDFIHPALGPGYSFEINLNRTHGALLASLEPTDFRLSYLRIDPPEARVARLAPLMLQADGIEEVGQLEWFDPQSRRELLLLYLDRPANITGRTMARGRPLRYAIRARVADYVWVARQSNQSEDVYTAVPSPARVLLAVKPPADSARTNGRPAVPDCAYPGQVCSVVAHLRDIGPHRPRRVVQQWSRRAAYGQKPPRPWS